MKAKAKLPTMTIDLRENLKRLVERELHALPEMMEGMEPKDRINVICKLLPFVMPKVEAVKSDYGEPTDLRSWGPISF
jgi:hypothetical protein